MAPAKKVSSKVAASKKPGAAKKKPKAKARTAATAKASKTAAKASRTAAKKAAPRASSALSPTKPIAVPRDLQAFLNSGRQLSYDTEGCEPGQITLLPLDKLVSGTIRVTPSDDDPHADDDGYYAVPAINLVAAAEGYDPEYILLWLPGEKSYGTYDPDHLDLFVFPDTTWADIADDPRPYVSAQWDGPEPGEPLESLKKYPFKMRER